MTPTEYSDAGVSGQPGPTPPRPVPELLAPAGQWESLRAAVANGADAVYFGLTEHNARHRAENFPPRDLPGVMRYLRDHHVRGYLTMNTLAFSDELEGCEDLIRAAAKAGVDALIVQDLGLTRLIRSVSPGLAIHGSTQMTLTDPRGAEFVRRLGVERVILARELSIHEIAKVRAGTSLPLEVFVHGALCVAYSGQCLTSESLGGRSANRGRCAQACRLPYELVVDGRTRELGELAYLLSPQDLSAHDLIGRLVDLGVSCFKIEGRLKSPAYVAAATRTYRSALDAALQGREFCPTREQLHGLAQTFSRGFTHGFLDGVNHQQLVHARFPKSRGVRIGTVIEVRGPSVIVQMEDGSRLAEDGRSRMRSRRPRGADAARRDSGAESRIHDPSPIRPGDGVVFDEGRPEQWEQGGRVYEARSGGKRGTIELRFGGGSVNLSAVSVGSWVWKTDDPRLRRELDQSYARDVVARPMRLDYEVDVGADRPIGITATAADGTRARVESEQAMPAAARRPIRIEVLGEQLGRLGGTPFVLGEVRLMHAGSAVREAPVMVPPSVLNGLRRRAVERLIGERERRAVGAVTAEAVTPGLRAAARGAIGSRRSGAEAPGWGGSARLHVLVRTMQQLEAALAWRDHGRGMIWCDFEDPRKYRSAVRRGRETGRAVGLTTVRVLKPGEEGLLEQIARLEPDAVLVRNLSAVSYLREHHGGLPLVGDYSLNVANELAAGVLAEAGLTRVTASYDLNWRQMSAMLERAPAGFFEVVIHQHMPMFHMEHCVFSHTLSDGTDWRSCGRPCDRHRVSLRDRVGLEHPLTADVGCRNTVYNGQAQSGAAYVPAMRRAGVRDFRVELLPEDEGETASVLDRYAALVAGREKPEQAVRRLTVLSQLGVTGGTLEWE